MHSKYLFMQGIGFKIFFILFSFVIKSKSLGRVYYEIYVFIIIYENCRFTHFYILVC